MSAIVSASTILATWALSLWFALTQVRVGTQLGDVWQLGLLVWLQFLYCGLFITAHDACHGSAAPHRPRLNLWIGRVAAACYAGFSFALLQRRHGQHHVHGGTLDDPDFGGPTHRQQRFVPWAIRFFGHYLSWAQLLRMAVAAQILLHVCQVRPENMYLFWVAPALLSAVQLFLFGTYLPHRIDAGKPFADQYRARNSGYGYWASLLSCYHFGYHHEHHVAPHLPWFALPRALADSRDQNGGPSGNSSATKISTLKKRA